ncbi:MAG: glycine zipper 2TM domain-containing protein [Betaproteobacteria bacterium]|nr:glycine zipper 2TM domain-containing protein [Betaproteobacteria bacterium]
MKNRSVAPLLLTALAAPAFATDYTDSAPVISSVPVYQTVNEPQQQCWTESVTSYEERRSPGGAILGGLTGGLIGNTIGRGDGRFASTAFGVVIGAMVGDHLANRDNSAVAVTRPIQRCQTVASYRQVLTGYQVTYNYNGRNTTVVLPYDPGPRVPIEVGITGSAAQSAYVGPPVARITYEQRRAPIWEEKPYKRPRHRHDDDNDRDWDR